MRGKQKKPSKTHSDNALGRPFERSLLKRAHDIVLRYKLLLEPDSEVGFIGTAIELPTVWGDGRTPDECVKETQEALVSAVATLLELGEAPPTPSVEKKRQEQINIRVTTEERILIEETARKKGFRGVSDFVRNAALSNAR